MAYGLKLAGANLVYKGGLFNGDRYLALLSAETVELTQNGYARESVALSDWQIDGRMYENAAQELFGPPTVAWPAIVGWAAYSALTAGDLLFNVEVTATDPPGIGATVGADAEGISYSFSMGTLTTTGSTVCMNEGLVSGTRYLILSSGTTPDAGDGSTDDDGNFINTDGTTGYGASRTPVGIAVTEGQWSLDTVSTTQRRARNNVALNYGVQSANLPDPMSVALTDGSGHGSNILWYWTVTADDPGLGDALSWGTNSLSIELNFTA